MKYLLLVCAARFISPTPVKLSTNWVEQKNNDNIQCVKVEVNDTKTIAVTAALVFLGCNRVGVCGRCC